VQAKWQKDATERWQTWHQVFVISFSAERLVKISAISQNIMISTQELISDKNLPMKNECSFSLFSRKCPCLK